MDFVCRKCGSNWEETPESGAMAVQCPECFSVLPVGAASTLGAPAVNDLPTVLDAGQPKVADVPPGMRTRTVADASAATPTRTMPPTEPAGRATDATTIDHHLDDELPLFSTSPAGPSPFDKTVTPAPPSAIKPDAIHLSDVATQDAARQDAARPAAPRRDAGAMPKDLDFTGRAIGGYEVKGMLGAGGMGAVCLARQKSLDRDVALKILPATFAANPEFLARFTREALSAAQLSHHNIVQVHDVGSDSDIHYISMEYVRGDNLGAMIRRDGKLTLDDALGYVLQAARGLKYAHDRGIVHRDIKPDNLMVNEHGIVKIADMGLAKMRGDREEPSAKVGAQERTHILRGAATDITLNAVAMGTPAYMAPEQARDAASVDHRADQYSLGCTIYYLVAGKAPYSGSTAYEIISKHQSEPLPPLETFVRNVPLALNEIIQRMLQKDPAKRYADMGGVVRDLEAFLGLESEKGPYRPREIHMAVLEDAQKQYYGAPSLKKRRLAVAGFLGITGAAFLIALFAGQLALAGGIAGFAVMAPLANFILDGVLHKSFLFRRVRSVFFGMTLRGWAATLAVAALFLLALWVTGLLGWWIAAGVLAAAAAAAYQYLAARPLSGEREAPVQRVQDMLKQLRVRGVSEEAIHDFVCRFGGEDWEELFENLFGYQAMVAAREKWATTDRVKPRRRFATWRDPVARWLDGVEQNRRSAGERRQLAKVEAKRLKAQGVGEVEAQKRAEESATRILGQIRTETLSKYEDPLAPAKKRRAVSTGPVGPLFRLARLMLGVVMLLPFAANMLQALAPQLKLVVDTVNSLPLPRGVVAELFGYMGAASGAALVFSALSARILGPLLVTVGALLMVFRSTVAGLAASPQLGAANLIIAAGALMAAGIAVCFLAKMKTGRF
jgi:eukaryotic-like serine/threonine-protein kinase